MNLRLRDLLKDRWQKEGLYDSPAYWDKKAALCHGLARSNWPSNAYNRLLHTRQMQLVDQLLGQVAGLRIADVGCGTGRASLHLAQRGALVTGFDFSEEALRAAEQEATREGLTLQWVHHNVLFPFAPDHHQAYHAALVLGCLTLACSSGAALNQALGNVVALLRPGGRVLFVEPIHSSRLLRRILAMTVPEWIGRCQAARLELLGQGVLLFVPGRYLLAFRDWPEKLVRTVFDAGERVLSSSPRLIRLSDYKWLLFRQAGTP